MIFHHPILFLSLIFIVVATLLLTFILVGPSNIYVGSGPLFFSRTDFGDPVFLTVTTEESPGHIVTRAFDFHRSGCLTVAISLLLTYAAAALMIRRILRRRPAG